MLNQLKNYGCVSKMISLEIFDYLHDEFHDMIEIILLMEQYV